jgi:hypothetical protein
LATGDEEKQYHEKDPGGPRCDAQASTQSGHNTAQHAALAWSDQTLPGEPMVDVVHGHYKLPSVRRLMASA